VIALAVGLGFFDTARAATISGTVTESDGITPIAGVTVNIYDGITGVFSNAYAVTDSQGDYSVSDLAAGNYAAQAYGATVDQYGYVSEYSDNIIVTATQVYAGVDFSLERGGAIEGTVTDCTTGSGIAGLSVFIYTETGGWVDATFSASDGSFHQGGLAEGRNYIVEVEGYGTDYQTKSYGGTFLVNAAQITDAGSICLPKGGSISGTVDDGSSAISGIVVTAYTEAGFYVSNSITNSSGDYTIQGLPLGKEYWVEANAHGTMYISQYYPTLVEVTSGAPDTAGIDFTLDVGCFISGRVVDEVTSDGVYGITVQAYHAYSMAWTDNAITASDGSFIIQGLPKDRQYRIEADTYGTDYLKEFYQDTVEFENAAVVFCDSSLPSLEIGRGETITGTVTDAGTGLGVAGITMTAYVYDPDWEDREDQKKYDYFGSSQTNMDGNYSIGGLRVSQQYIIEANTYGTKYVLAYYNGTAGGTIDMNEATLLTPPRSGIDFSLTEGGTVSGTVTANGAGIEGLTMLVYADAGIDSWGNKQYAYITSAMTGSDGSYSVRGLPNGYNYIIKCNTYSFPYIEEIYNNAASMEDATLVALGSTNINFDLAAGASISGMVTENSGAGIPGIILNAYLVSGTDDDGNVSYGYVASGLSGGNGAYSIQGLPDGDYIIEASTYGTFYKPEYYDEKSDINDAGLVAAGSGNINFVLDRGGEITGTVSAGGSATGAQLAPAAAAEASLPDITITAYAVGSDEPVAQTRNEPNGAYNLVRLPAGLYTVEAKAPGYAAASYSPVEVVLGERTSLSIELYTDGDADGLPDWWELENNECLSPGDPGDGGAGDGDTDGLTNAEEYELGTDPCLKDSDGDGMEDGQEVEYGLDPLTDDADGDADGDGYSNYYEYSLDCDPVQPPATIYVDATIGSDATGDGSRGNPYKTVATAMGIGCVGDTIRTLAGSYVLDSDLQLGAGVSLIGVRAQDCILDLADHSIVAADYSTVAGFTVMNPPVSGGIVCNNIESPEISNNIILGASGAGIVLDNTTARVINNTLLDLDTGIDLTHGSAPTIYNNIIAYNGAGIQTDGTADLSGLDYNNLWSNGTSLLQGSNNVYSDPLFVDEINYHLQFDSLARDAGNPAEAYNDKDGSRNDMGADGGPRGVRDENVPALEIMADPSGGNSPLEVSFIGAASDEWGIYSYTWDFGDGSAMVNGQNPDHTYDNCEQYLVSLTVADNSGLEASAIRSIRVGDPPVVSIDADPAVGSAPLTVSFNSPAGNVSSWSWDFDAADGIGEDSSLQAPSYTYREPGAYIATLRVASAGCQAMTTAPVTVLDENSQLASWQLMERNGGTITTPDDTSLDIPPGALSQEAVITLAKVGVYPDLPDGLEVIGTVWDIGPSGLALSRAATLEIPYDESELQLITGSTDPYQLLGYSYNDTEGWQQIEISSAGNGSVSFKINHFSLYTLALGGEAPATPSNLTLTPQSETSIRLNWWDNSDNEEGFKLYRNDTPLAVLGYSDVTSFRDTGLTPGTTYTYTVRAYNRFGISDPSNAASARTNLAASTPVPSTDDNPGSGTTDGNSDNDGGGGGGSSSFCFIATAAYGTPMAKPVKILCRFRDRFLLTNKPGSKFVEFYYRHSPPIADYIADRPYLKAMIRIGLLPLIGFSWVALVTSWWQKLILLLIMAGTFGWRLLIKRETKAS
jgi:PKD repeat protein